MRRRREWSAAGLPWVVDLMRVHALDTAVTFAAGGRESEARRELRMVDLIDRADLYWITARMTDLVIGAAETVPDWTPAVAIPSDCGLIVWETPVGVTTDFGGVKCEVSGMLWETSGDTLKLALLIRHDAPPLVAVRPIQLPHIEAIRPADYADDEIVAMVRLIASTWLLMGQERIVDTATVPSPGTSKRAAAAGRPWTMPEVQVVEVQGRPGGDRTGAGAGREWHHRWWVRGHWRQQVCGLGRSQRRPVWIDPHIKGPDAAPLADTPTVRVLRR